MAEESYHPDHYHEVLMSKMPILAMLLLLGSGLNPGQAQEKVARPNILLLVTDDQRADCLGCTGHPLLKTPHIDRLAKEGVRFKNAFVTTAICCISRASIYTGLYGRKHQVGDFQTPLPKNIE